ncbi:semaphorin-7A [Eucyclogobius newberryi]|uniref:semaphorin-7A n=1 Tax=Eucyclogobius newberryi TaxID=166745 RepID=UPI003B5A4F1C
MLCCVARIDVVFVVPPGRMCSGWRVTAKSWTQTLTMEWLFLCICLAGEFNLVLNLLQQDAPTLGSKNAPRLVTKNAVKITFDYEKLQNHTVFFYSQDNGDMYVGGTEFVLRLNTNNYQIIEKYDVITTPPPECKEDSCQNVITVIEDLKNVTFVCGTNGHNPQCWTLVSDINLPGNNLTVSADGSGISPVVYSQNSLSLTVEGDLYAAAPLVHDGSSLQFRRKAGTRTRVWMDHKWALEPTYIAASWVERKNDSDNEKIYVFFREKNPDTDPEADRWISMVARVCKVDEGGSKQFFQNMWTTFLKARLVCGIREEKLYFNRLQDVYVQHDENWSYTRVYAIFRSSWNATAVCIFTIGTIDEVFEKSLFNGYNEEIPTPRPGSCVKNSKTLPLATVRVVKHYPEMADWIHGSLHPESPFYVSSYNYTKIAVDQVQAADGNLYNVLLLATDSGKIHKVLEAGLKPVVISETQLLNRSAILSFKLDSKKRKLVVGFSDVIMTVDLQKCEHRTSCEDCVLAQDPYCAWSVAAVQCTAVTPGNIQNLMTGNPNVCPTRDAQLQSQREAQSLLFVHSVPLDVPFYLSCPIDSYHADYSWEHKDRLSPCLQLKSNCLHLIPSIAPEHYGNYQCVSREQGYNKMVKQYILKGQNLARLDPPSLNNALQPVPRVVWLTLGLLLKHLTL